MTADFMQSLLEAGGHKAGFPLESPGEVALGVESQLFRHGRDALPFLKKLCRSLDFQLQQVFVNADSGVFVEDAFDTCFTDIAEPGYLRNRGLSVNIAVQITDGPAESDGVRGIRNGGNGTRFS